ncbi:MAG: SEC-C domain-containing protein [Candidatus Eremiobacteraeota bacterium]|nr:SEC-C domain-containing protein [Candidatus Eremiobacteraeota bacterium]
MTQTQKKPKKPDQHHHHDHGDGCGCGHDHNERTVKRDGPKIGRNDKCPCGSDKKYKKCCGA